MFVKTITNVIPHFGFSPNIWQVSGDFSALNIMLAQISSAFLFNLIKLWTRLVESLCGLIPVMFYMALCQEQIKIKDNFESFAESDCIEPMFLYTDSTINTICNVQMAYCYSKCTVCNVIWFSHAVK